ncbi:MAG: hypothetical protein HY815_14550, partial [Candidatus Riflebacteria bacterium]|nr:hypothetical protein [Candidatus Riflebacteria bacterium]
PAARVASAREAIQLVKDWHAGCTKASRSAVSRATPRLGRQGPDAPSPDGSGADPDRRARKKTEARVLEASRRGLRFAAAALVAVVVLILGALILLLKLRGR